MSKFRNSLIRGVRGLFSLVLGTGAFASPPSSVPPKDPSSIEARVEAVRAAVEQSQVASPAQRAGDVTATPVAQWGNWGNWNNWGNWVNWNNWNNWGNWANWRNF